MQPLPTAQVLLSENGLDLVIKVPKNFSVKLGSTNTNNAPWVMAASPKLAQ
jgi:hypothetical protein